MIWFDKNTNPVPCDTIATDKSVHEALRQAVRCCGEGDTIVLELETAMAIIIEGIPNMGFLDKLAGVVNPLTRIAGALERIADSVSYHWPVPKKLDSSEPQADLIETTDAQHAQWETERQARVQAGLAPE